MPTKEVYLFDDSNNPLKVAGISLELFDTVTGRMLVTALSANRKPHLGGTSTDWGADLPFTASTHPVDIYINDPTYTYPGNVIESLNGQITDRIDIDLLKLPATPIGTPVSGTTMDSLVGIIKEQQDWTNKEKIAVIAFIFNYIKTVTKNTIESPELPQGLVKVIANWNESLNRLGIDPDILRISEGALAY